jgi:hypothetical protein
MINVRSISAAVLALAAGGVFASDFSRDSIQTIYRQGVPHTDKNGALRTTYDPAQSFFQIGMWGTPLHGYEQGYFYDWQQLKSAGFNTAWTWYKPAVQSLQSGWTNDMQVVLMGEASTNDLGIIAGNANLRNRLLGTAWADEPTTQTPLAQMQAKYNAFQAYRNTVHSFLPNSPVFVTDAPAFGNGATARQWWETWANGGDLTSQDNYPIRPDVTSIGRVSPPGIPESVSLATSTLNQQKPVWFIVSAYETADPNDSFPQRFATPTQMRAQVYSAIIHGATGIVYFTWDSLIGRHSNNLGISPNPTVDGYNADPGYYEATMTPDQISRATAAWNAAASTNAEIQALAPAILSPTVAQDDLSYSLSLQNLSAPNNTSLYSDTPIRTLLKKDPQGRYVLMAVNLDGRSMDVNFNLSKVFSDFDLLYESDGGYFNALGTASNFTYHFDPYATHVFSIGQSVTSWNVNKMGDWATAGNWTGGVPNGIDASTTLGAVITAPRTIYTDVAITLGTLRFDNINSYMIAGQGSLSINVSTGVGSIDVLRGSHKINLPLLIQDNTNANVATGATLRISDPITLAGGTTLTKTGNGTLIIESPVYNTQPATFVSGAGVTSVLMDLGSFITLNVSGGTTSLGARQHLSSLNVAGGTVTLGSGVVVSSKSLSISGSGKLDLNSDRMIVDYTGSSVLASVKSAIDSGNLVSSLLASGRAIGYGEASDLFAGPTGSFAGETVDSSSILLAYTIVGDASLDQTVNSVDFNLFAAKYGTLAGARWTQGDFDGDSKVTSRDFNLLAGSFGQSLSPSLGAIVPEPASSLFLLLVTMGIFRRR